MDYKSTDRSIFSRWASPGEIKESLYRVEMNIKPEFGGIPFYCENGAVYVDHLDSHTMIASATASKKTRNIGMPALQLLSLAGESFIATDPKAELYERTLPLLKKQNYDIFVMNLRDPQKSNCWNPLILPYELYKKGKRDLAIELIVDMSNSFINDNTSDSYWYNCASNLLCALILILFECGKENEIHLKSLRSLRRQALKQDLRSDKNKSDYTPPFIVDHFLEHLDGDVNLFSFLNGIIDICDTTRGCIISQFDQSMRLFFSQDNMINLLSGSEIDLSSIGKKKTAVFLIIPDEKTVYHRLVSIFIKQCYTELINEAQKYPNKSLPVRVNFLLDEFSNLPKIADFPNMLTACRSRGIRFALIVQSINQIRKWYGDDAETIKGNCENWIFLFSRELQLLEELVKLAGLKGNEEPLVSIPMLQTLNKEKGEAFILNRRKNPYIANLMDIDEYEFSVPDEYQIECSHNGQKTLAVFDFDKFCKEKSGYFLSQLFDGKKITEEEYYKLTEDDYEPAFRNGITDLSDCEKTFTS